MREINKIVVHCAATPPAMDVGVAEIDKWHRQRGFTPTKDSPACGYHKVIRRNGAIERGRPDTRVGAHAAGHNTGTLAVCLVGGVKADGQTPDNNFTEAQFNALKAVIKGWWDTYGVIPVVGHGSLPGVAKACPSFDVSAWLKEANIE